MREIRVGAPAITAEGKRLVAQALGEGRISEGKLTRRLEEKMAEMTGAKDAVAVNSGNSALFLSLVAARELYARKRVVTTSLTFSATVSAALNAGLSVEVTDTDGFLGNHYQAKSILDGSPHDSVYVPVHLFGYPCESFPHQAFEVQDACEAIGTVRGGRPIGLPDLGCFSFYTSHAAGCGELGVVVASTQQAADFIRSMKDQGRRVARSVSHVEKMTPTPFEKRYSHLRVGWNMRTTDIQAALALGALSELPSIIERRHENVKRLNAALSKYMQFLCLPEEKLGVSYLAYPILCDTKELRNRLVEELEANDVETRPLLSVIPEEEAFSGKVKAPYGYEHALNVHGRGFYISCHESLGLEDVDYIEKVFGRVLG